MDIDVSAWGLLQLRAMARPETCRQSRGAQYRTIRGQSEDRSVFTASPKSSDGTGHEPAIAAKSRPVTARTALAIVGTPWFGCAAVQPDRKAVKEDKAAA